MANSKKPRKAYGPKAVIPDPVKFVILGSTDPKEDTKVNLKLKFKMAMATIARNEFSSNG